MFIIYRKFGKYDFEWGKAKTEESARALIEYFEREDHYEIEVEKYPMPATWNGVYPVYRYEKKKRAKRAA